MTAKLLIKIVFRTFLFLMTCAVVSAFIEDNFQSEFNFTIMSLSSAVLFLYLVVNYAVWFRFDVIWKFINRAL